MDRPVVMTIAGFDPSGGAGVAADLKTFFRFGCFGTAAITSLTFQNTKGVFGAESQSPRVVSEQIKAVLDDTPPLALKTGMLPDSGVIERVVETLEGIENIVVDPVVRSTSGFDLIDDEALESLVKILIPRSTLVTPNIQEAERIVGYDLNSTDELRKAGDDILKLGAANVLIKGGHGDGGEAVDHLFTRDDEHWFRAPRIETKSTHGTGCTLSAAIAANLAKGNSLLDSIKISKNYIQEAIKTSPNIGDGNPAVNHWAGLKIGGDK